MNDADTGLTYMQQRYYDPVLIGLISGDLFNRYLYANNNPYKFLDPDGCAVDSITMDKTHNVHIVVGITYTGAITPEKATALNQAVSAAWSGKFGEYAVNVTIIPGNQAKYGNTVSKENIRNIVTYDRPYLAPEARSGAGSKEGDN